MSEPAAALAGFRDPVHDAQRTFRAVLDALARPGTLQRVAAPDEQPTCLSPAIAALALSLLDHDTAVWLCPELCAAAPYFRFHADTPVTDSPGAAAFALTTAAQMPALGTLAAGTPLYPHRSCTVLCEVPALTGGKALRLTGPGIDGSTRLRCQGLPGVFVHQWSAQLARFPLGVDVLLTHGDRVCGLPRGVRIEEMG